MLTSTPFTLDEEIFNSKFVTLLYDSKEVKYEVLNTLPSFSQEVKLSAADIVKNIQAENNGVSIIPRGALVYLSTDDPKGLCENCLVQRIACTQYEPGKKPPGCPEGTQHCTELYSTLRPCKV